MQIWDTAGQERFQSLGRAFYRGAEACVLVFDITKAKSFDNLSIWKQEFLLKAMPKDPDAIPFFVLGNKVDLENERQVSQDRVTEFLKQNPEMIYYETSAVDGRHVNEAFLKIATNFIQIQNQMAPELTASGTEIGGAPTETKKKFDLES